MADLQISVQKKFDLSISDEEYQQALPMARQKLQHINHRYGTHYDDAYLAVLIAEEIRARRLSRSLRSSLS